MSLASFIRAQLEPIIEDWIRFARAIPAASRLADETLRDHAAGILHTICDDLERSQSAQQQEQKGKGRAPHVAGVSEAQSHGSSRLLDGFSVNDAVSEFRALRASVLRQWSRVQGIALTPGCIELTRFNEAIDQALTESLAGFSDDKARSTRLFGTLLSVTPDLSFIVDLAGRLIYGNGALGAACGQPLSALTGQPFALPDGDAADFAQHVRTAAQGVASVRGELTRGARVYEYLLAPVRDEQGQVEAVAGSARDITERKASEEKYRRSAHYDNLTGLPNRYLFGDRLAQEIKRAGRLQLPLALLFIDLDGFKQVNDQLGHEAGDALLRQGAARIAGQVRGTDSVARMGGDEFAALLTDIRNLPHVDILAQHIVDQLALPFTLGTRAAQIGCSIGIALYPRDATSAEELLRHADQAMYAVKKDGGGSFAFFTPAMRAAASARMKLIGELRGAIAHGQLLVYYQPIIDLAGGAIVGAAAQVRWQHPAQGLLAASQFFGLAEEAGLAAGIDEWVLADALARARQWQIQRGAALLVTINKSAQAGAGSQGTAHWQTIVARLAQASAPVTLEFTEAALHGARSRLAQLGAAGVRLCLDDFGAGNAAMSSLTAVPLAALKIDQSLVRELAQNGPRALAAGIIVAAHGLGLKVIAEGVEDADQSARLRAVGCDYAQGFLFSEALAGPRFTELLAQGALFAS